MRWEKRGFQVRWATRRADVWPALSAGVTHDDEMSARLVSEMDQLEAYRRREEGSRQGLTLVHFSAQPEPFLTQNTPITPHNTSSTTPKQLLHAAPIPQKVLTLIIKVDECKPLAPGRGPPPPCRPLSARHGGFLRTSTRPTLCSEEPCPRFCMSIHSGRKPCSDIGSSACSRRPFGKAVDEALAAEAYCANLFSVFNPPASDPAGNGVVRPGRYRSPRHRMTFHSINEGFKCF